MAPLTLNQGGDGGDGGDGGAGGGDGTSACTTAPPRSGFGRFTPLPPSAVPLNAGVHQTREKKRKPRAAQQQQLAKPPMAILRLLSYSSFFSCGVGIADGTPRLREFGGARALAGATSPELHVQRDSSAAP